VYAGRQSTMLNTVDVCNNETLAACDVLSGRRRFANRRASGR
jgi:hypothetical protein